MKQHLQNGFTLIEIIVVLVIIGILAAIAVPNYQAYIRKSACEDTKAVITGAAARMERFKAQSNTYETATLDEYKEAPIDGNKKHAEIEISEPTASSYTLTATGVGVLAGKGTLTLDSTGVRGGTGALANAWGSCSGI